jgi:hypothetical protein
VLPLAEAISGPLACFGKLVALTLSRLSTEFWKIPSSRLCGLKVDFRPFRVSQLSGSYKNVRYRQQGQLHYRASGISVNGPAKLAYLFGLRQGREMGVDGSAQGALEVSRDVVGNPSCRDRMAEYLARILQTPVSCFYSFPGLNFSEGLQKFLSLDVGFGPVF